MTFASTHIIPFDYRSVVRNLSHYHPYQYDSEPDSHYRQPPSRGPRPLTSIALKLQDVRAKCGKNLGWSIDWAVAFIVDHLDKNPGAIGILKNIRIRAADLEREGYAREIPYRFFNKLDEMLFAGHLKNSVFLDIQSLDSDVSGATHSQGWGLDPKVKRVSIILNDDVLAEARARDIIAILIHHMIHAYFLIACGPQKEKQVSYGRLNHGLHFGKIMSTIKSISDTDGRPLKALDYGHSLLTPSRYFYDEYYHHQKQKQRSPSRSRTRREDDEQEWYCSHCYPDVEPLSSGEIEDWYKGVCKPLFNLPDSLRTATVQVYNDGRHALETVPRAETTASTASHEFIFKDSPVLVPASKTNTFFSIARAFEKAGSRYLKMHDKIGKDAFEKFIELLHTGTYSPDPKHLVRITGNIKGTPVIKAASEDPAEPYLLSDIRMFKMGCVTGFDELKGIALDRMYRYTVTREDPVALLKEIYDGGEPDPDLKAWVRKFLVKTPTSADGSGGGGETWLACGMTTPPPGATTTTEPSNLAKLESDLLSYKPAFTDLLENRSALKYEVAIARRELLAANLYAPATGMFVLPVPVPILPVQRPLSPYAVQMPIASPLGLMPPPAHMVRSPGLPLARVPVPVPWASAEEILERQRRAQVAAMQAHQAQAQAQAEWDREFEGSEWSEW
jgi:hypothetical protein